MPRVPCVFFVPSNAGTWHGERVSTSLFPRSVRGRVSMKDSHRRELMRVANVSDFQLQDLTRPDPQRFMTHMSAFVNMYRFHSSRIKVFDAFSVDVGDAETERDNLADRIDAAQEQISRIVCVSLSFVTDPARHGIVMSPR